MSGYLIFRRLELATRPKVCGHTEHYQQFAPIQPQDGQCGQLRLQMGRSHSSSSQGFWTWLRFCGGQSGEQTCIHRPGFVQRALSVKNQEKAFPSVATMFEAHYVLWEISLCTVALRAPLIPVCTYSYLFPTLPLKTPLEFTHDEDVESS